MRVQVFLKYEVQETITDREKVMEVRQVSARALQPVFESGKVVADGVFADARGGFVVLEANSAEEIFDMFAPVIDYLRMETHPLMSVEKLQEFFERDAAGGGVG
jgi:uncharacterized protein YciI